MGIGGLLPLLKEIQKPSHVREWKGKTVAVDGYVWLHRGAYGCAEELALGKPTVKYVNYAMHRVRMLKYFGVTPMLVFDGGNLPSKVGTEDERERRRTEALAKGRAFLAEGKGSQARECFVKAVDVTPAMAYQLIKALKREGVQYVVAPYEADPQLCYLEKHGIVDAIITEDSDLLVFGCRNVLFKMDGEGNCVSISRDDFSKCREFNLAGWSDTEFRQMAILSGCDYAGSIVGLGLKTAYKLMRKYKTAEKVVQFVRLEGQLTVPRDYLDEFRRAELTFLHQHVFDPVQRKLVHLHPLPEGKTVEDLPFIGPLLEHDFACGLADGDIDPISKEAMVDLVPDSFPAVDKPQQGSAYRPTASTSASSSKPKAAPAPIKGAGSILSFFSRQSPAASTSTAVNPVKAVANQRRVKLVGGEGKGKENEAETAPAPARSSRFFGSSASKGKGKERAVEIEVEVEVEVETTEAEMMEVDVEADDDEAEAALREVEMVESVISVTSAESNDHQAVAVASTSTTIHLVKPAPPRLSPPTPTRSPLREPSAPSCISSPASTPRARKRVKLSHPSPLSPNHQTRTADAVFLSSDPLPSDGGISSPAESTRADAGWADDGGLSSPVAKPSSLAPKALNRPQPTPPVRIKPEPAHSAAAIVVKPPKKSKKVAVVELSSDPIVLSSDAPDFPSPSDEREDLQERTLRHAATAAPALALASSRKDKPRRQPKEAAKSPEGKSKAKPQRERRGSEETIRVRADEEAVELSKSGSGSATKRKKAAVGKGKKRVKVEEQQQGEEEEEENEAEAAVKTVAAGWRAKFMMPLSKTPQGKPSLFGRSLLPTPSTTSRPPSLENLSTSPKKSATASKRTTPPLTTSARRTPLSPKSSNRIVNRQPLLVKPGSPLKRSNTAASSSQEDQHPSLSISPPAKKRRSSVLADGSTLLVAAVGGSSGSKPRTSSGAATDGLSSSPVVVTNPRLLAFKFSGSVKRN